MNILFNTIFSQREYNHYNYDEILPIVEHHKNNLNSETISNDLYKIIKKENIKKVIWNNKEQEL